MNGDLFGVEGLSQHWFVAQHGWGQCPSHYLLRARELVICVPALPLIGCGKSYLTSVNFSILVCKIIRILPL